MIRYEHRSRLTERHLKFGDFKNRLEKLEKLKWRITMNPTQISYLKTEIFEGEYKPVIPCSEIPLTDNQLPTINSCKLITNNYQKYINECDIFYTKN